jgi:aryl-alcohol dehydrogenase-like predicted oxidoreductase
MPFDSALGRVGPIVISNDHRGSPRQNIPTGRHRSGPDGTTGRDVMRASSDRRPAPTARVDAVEQRYLGRSGLRVSEIGLGTLTWGRETDEDVAAAQLDAFRTGGGTLIDTAAGYAGGAAEALIGRLLAGTGERDEVVLATKAGVSGTSESRRIDNSRAGLLRDLDGSLRRLGVDHVDLWQVQTVDPHVPADETLNALDTAVASGKARYAGVSNYGGWRLAQAATWQAALPGRTPIVSDQVEYSLLERGVERELIPACLDLGVGVLSYSPLGGGVLTGKYRQAAPAGSRATAGSANLAEYSTRRALGIVEAVATAADGLGAHPVAVALGWLRRRPAVSAAVVGARTLAQLTTALQALSVVIPVEILAALDEVSAPTIGYPEDVH